MGWRWRAPSSLRHPHVAWLLALPPLILVSIVALYFVLRPRSAPPAEAAPPNPPLTATPEPSLSQIDPDPPPPSSSEPAAVVSIARPTTPRVPVPAPPAIVSGPKPVAGDCNPPFFVQDGIKHYKKHCKLE